MVRDTTALECISKRTVRTVLVVLLYGTLNLWPKIFFDMAINTPNLNYINVKSSRPSACSLRLLSELDRNSLSRVAPAAE